MTAKRIIIGRSADVTVLNPILYSDLNTGEVVNRLFDHLVLTDDDVRYIPGRLLTHWEVREDGLVWDFHLRPGARWHDGEEVTAADAAFTFQTILDPATGSKRRTEFLVDGRPIALEAVDRYRLRVRLPAPFASFLASLAWRPLIPRHLYAGQSVTDHPQNLAPVGSGAFTFHEWQPGSHLTMRAYTGYHLGRPPLDEVVWRCFPDPEPAVAALVEGVVDYVPGVPPAVARGLESEPHLNICRSVDATFTYLGFQMEHPIFQDVRVRRAICHTIDRERLVREVLCGEGQIAHGMVTPLSPWHNPEVPRYAHDPAAAGRLFDEAGWLIGPHGVRINPSGREFAFTILTVKGDRVKECSAALIAEDCAQVGVRVRVESHEMGHLLQTYVYPRRFEAVLMALAPGADPGYLHAFYHSAMLTPVGWNRLSYQNPAVDRLLEASQTEMHPERRKQLLDQAQVLIIGDVPQVFLFHPTVVDAANRRVWLPQQPRTPGNRFMHLHRWDISG